MDRPIHRILAYPIEKIREIYTRYKEHPNLQEQLERRENADLYLKLEGVKQEKIDLLEEVNRLEQRLLEKRQHNPKLTDSIHNAKHTH